MKTVLVIDDSSFQRKWLAQTITSLGYEVIQAENGKEGLELVARQKPCFITVDLNMPVMTGLEFLQALDPKTEAIPTIVITSDIQEETKRECRLAGATAFLNKPFSLPELEQVISTFSQDTNVGQEV